MNYAEKAKSYAKSVASGKITAGKWVKLSCERFLSDLKRQGAEDFPYVFNEEAASRVCRFMEKMPHVKGSEWVGKSITLEPWQCFIECNLFGWLHKKTGYRRFRESFELIPRKNGKSMRVAARGIYLAFIDGEKGGEVYSGATSEKQAFEVFRPAWMMCAQLPLMQQQFSITLAGNAKNPGTMYRTSDMSRFEVLIGKPGDGASVHGAIIDEYHEHDSDHMYETMKTGMGARRQPLLSIISTAGSTLNGPCHEMQADMQKILEGTVRDETIFAIIYGIDKDDDWTDPKSLIKANPNYNVSVFEEFLMSQLEQAKRSSSKQNAFRTKHLNEWVGARSAWMNMVLWNKQRMPAEITMQSLCSYPCRISADLSSKKDVTAVDITFKKGVEYFSFKKFFVPESMLEENDSYMNFMLGGYLETTDGSMVDQERIEEYISDLLRTYKVIDTTFDEWNAAYMMTRLQKLRTEIISFPFRTQYVSDPMKQIEALVLDGKYWHDGNPMMDWMVGNVAVKEDLRGNIFPNKARVNDHRCKIDGVAASIMNMARWMAVEEPKKEYSMFFV